jgi:hypothetical protein
MANKEFSVTYCASKHIAQIEQNGGLKQLQKQWSETMGKPMIAKKQEDGTIFVVAKGRKRFDAKTR